MQQTDEGRERDDGKALCIFGIVSAYMSATILPLLGPLVCLPDYASDVSCSLGRGEIVACSFKPVLPPCRHDGSRLAFNGCMNGTSDGISDPQDVLAGKREMFYCLKIP